MSDQEHLSESEIARLVLATFTTSVDPAVRAAHLHKMSEIEIAQVSAAPARRRRTLVRGAVAAAGLVLVGGSALAATGTLPLIQDVVADAVDGVVDLPGGKVNATGGNPTNPKAAANKAEAEAFTDAKKAFNACKKAERQAAETASPDPSATPVESACGEKPERSDFKTDSPDRTAKPSRTDNPAGKVPGEPSAKPARSPVPNKAADADRADKPARTDNPHKPSPPASPVEDAA